MEGGGGGGGGGGSSAAFKLGFPKRKALKAEKAAISAEQREEITEAFALFDVDKVGSIDYHELKVAMRALGCDVRKAEVKALVADYSKDGSERVDFEAFLAISAFDSGSAGRPFASPRARSRFPPRALHPYRFPSVSEKYLARDPEAEFRKAFALFDEEGTGAISLKNLKKVARELGEDIPDTELEAMIEEVRGCARAPFPPILLHLPHRRALAPILSSCLLAPV